MLDVRVYRGAPPRGFLYLLDGARYTRAEATYIHNFALSPLNPIFSNGAVAFLEVYRDGVKRARLMTYTDEIYNMRRAAGERTGFFTLIDGANDPEAVNELINSACKIQREWRNARLTGPISPDGSGFFHGLAVRGLPDAIQAFDARNGAHIEYTLTQYGFHMDGEALAFSVRVPENNPLNALAARAVARFGVHVRRIRLSALSEGDEIAIHALSDGGVALSDTLRQLARLRRLIENEHSFIAHIAGAPVGFLLCLKCGGNLVRVSTLMCARSGFASPATLALLSALIDSLIQKGRAEVYVSQIDAHNARCLMCVKRFAGAQIGAFRRYTKSIHKI